MNVQVHEGGAELLDTLWDEWTQLSGGDPLRRPEWTRSYLTAFAPAAEVRILAARVDGRLGAVLPLRVRRDRFLLLPVRTLGAAANVHSCRFDLLRGDDAAGEAAALALWRHLIESPGWTALEFRDVPVDGELSRLAGSHSPGGIVATAEGLQSPWFALPAPDADWDAWLQRLRGDFRRELRRRARKLAELGEVTLRRVEQPSAADLQSFYDLEAAGWKGQEGSAIAADAATRRFYDELARQAGEAGYLTLYFLQLDGRPIAAHFGLSHGGCYYIPKVGYDEQYARFSPGQLLLHDVARDLHTRGVSTFDFLGPTMPWKQEWTSQTRPLQHIFVFRRSALGAALCLGRFGWRRAARRVRDAMPWR